MQLENAEEVPEQVSLALQLPGRSGDKGVESKSAGVDFRADHPQGPEGPQ